MTTQLALYAPKVTIHNGKAITTTDDIAAYFGKQPHHVVKKVESLECSEDFIIRNFSRMIKIVQLAKGATREVIYYEMTKDGFVFLVMGFTGMKAAAFKEAYITEFNRMEAALNHHPVPDIHRYQVRVIIHDEVTGITEELRGESNDLRAVTFGICTDLGFKPNSFTHVPAKPQIKRLH